MNNAGQPPVLALDQVSLGFGDDLALYGVDLQVARGETLVVHGAAGSGKTLLLKIMLGLLRPTAGTIRLFERDVTSLPEKEWFDVRSRIGVLFQEGGLFDSLTVGENVGYPLRNQRLLRVPEDQIEPRVEESLEFVELGHTLERFPSELSGGMRRRVGIARAIVTQPELMLYDSPTAGLDPITANNIMTLILKGRDTRGATTILVTHRHQDGEILERYRFDAASGGLRPAGANGDAPLTRYMVLKEGAIVFHGPPREFDASIDPYVAKFASR